MAEATRRGSRARLQAEQDQEQAIKDFFTRDALAWLALPNVAGVMLGKKRVAGRESEQDAVIFRVERKLVDRSDILSIGSKPFPDEIVIGGRRYVTDVLEGAHHAHDGAAAAFDPRQRFPTICPGVSISNAGVPGDVGTGTAVVRHRQSGRLALLSCDHVLARRDGNGEATQPGRGDHSRPGDVFGRVLGGMRGLHGDAAIAAIERRAADARIPGLGIAIADIALPRAGDLVIKVGRSTGISYGTVTAQVGAMSVDYADLVEPIDVYGFEIAPIDGQVPIAGDSGAPWLLADPQSRRPTGTLVGIHTAGTRDGSGSFACFVPEIFQQLGIELASPSDVAGSSPLLVAATAPGGGPDILRVNARSGLILRGGAGREFDPVRTLPYGTIVHRVGVSGQWTKVDLAGDGAADGFLYSPFLEPAHA